MNSDDDDDDDDDILLSDVLRTNTRKNHHHVSATLNSRSNSNSSNILDNIFQESTNHYQSHVRLQTMKSMTTTATAIASSTNNTSVTPESTSPGASNNNNNNGSSSHSNTTHHHSNPDTTTTNTTSTTTNDDHHHHSTTPTTSFLNSTTHAVRVVLPTTTTTTTSTTIRSDDALRDTIQQLIQSLPSNQQNKKHKKQRPGHQYDDDDNDDNDNHDDESHCPTQEGSSQEWYLFESRHHRNILQRAHDDDMCRRAGWTVTIPPTTTTSTTHGLDQHDSSSLSVLLIQRYLPMTRIGSTDSRRRRNRHTPSVPVSSTTVLSPVTTTPQRRRLKHSIPSPSLRTNTIHFFTSYTEAMEYYSNEILIPSRALLLQQQQQNDIVTDMNMNNMIQMYTQTIPVALQNQMLHTVIPNYIHSLQQLFQSKNPTLLSPCDQRATDTDTPKAVSVSPPLPPQTLDVLLQIHQHFFTWLLGMACSIDVLILQPLLLGNDDNGTTTDTSMSSTSIRRMMHATGPSSIQFVLALQQYQFDHHHPCTTSHSATSTVSIRDVWYQLSHDWFHHTPTSTTTATTAAAGSSNNDRMDHHGTTLILNVHGFMNYLLYCEGLMGYIVPSSSTMNIDAGFHIIHTLLCCSFIYSHIQPLPDIIRRIVYDLIMLLLDPVVVVSGPSSSTSSQPTSILHLQRYKVLKSIAKVTMHGMPQLFMNQSAIRDSNSSSNNVNNNNNNNNSNHDHDDDGIDDDPNMWLSLPYAIRTCIPLSIFTSHTRWDHATLLEFKAILALRAMEELVFRHDSGVGGGIDRNGTTVTTTETFETTIEYLLTTQTQTPACKVSKIPWSKLMNVSSSSSSIGWFALGTAYCSLRLMLNSSNNTKSNQNVQDDGTSSAIPPAPEHRERIVFDINDTAKVLATIECVIELYETGILLLRAGDDNSNNTKLKSVPISESTGTASPSTVATSSSATKLNSPSADACTNSSTKLKDSVTSPSTEIILGTSKSATLKMKTEFGPWKNINHLHNFIKLFDDICTNLSTSVLAPKAIHPHYRRADILMKYVHIDTMKVEERLLALLDKYKDSLLFRKMSSHNSKTSTNGEEVDDSNDDDEQHDENDNDSEVDWEDIEQKRRLSTPKKKNQTKIVSFFAPTATSSSNKKAKIVTEQSEQSN